MVPDKFNMVDMGGIDLILMQGEEVPGLYNRLVESIAQCRYQCLYNWSFDGVIIPPTYVEMEVEENEDVTINDGVTVTQDDVIHIYTIEPPPPDPVIVSLIANENGEYTVPEDVDGFNPVTVNVTPVIESKTITENGEYSAGSGVDGFSPVIVNVSGIATPVGAYVINFTPGSDASSVVSAGMKFTVYQYLNINVSKLRVWPRSSPVNLYISKSDGTLISSILNVAVTPGQWNEVSLEEPVSLLANTEYVVWYSTASPVRYKSSATTPAVPLLKSLTGVQSFSGRDTFPTIVQSSSTFGIDIYVESCFTS